MTPRTAPPQDDMKVDTDTITQFLSGGTQPATDFDDTVPAPAAPVHEHDGDEDVHGAHVEHQINQGALDAAGGNPDVWATEFAAFIGHTTGTWIDTATITGWLNAYGAQIQTLTFRQSAFAVANTTLPATAEGDPAFLLLQLRDELTASFKRKAGQ